MKPDRQSRGQRLPTVPETTSLLGKPGADATSPRAFAARSPPQPRRLLPYVAACMALGLLALYFLGALPIGSSSGAWIRSLPQKRHNPAAKTPELPQPTDAQLDAAASPLEGGALQPAKQASGDAGSGSVKLDSSDPGSADGISGGSPGSSGDNGSSDPAPDDADSDAQQPVKTDEHAAQNAALQASIPAAAPAPDVKATAAEEESRGEGLQAAADSPAEQQPDAAQSGSSGPALQANQTEDAAGSTDSGLEAPDSSGGGDSDANGRGSAGSNAEGPLASGDGTGKQAAAPEQMAPNDSSAKAASSSAASPADSGQSTAIGSRSGDSSQDADAGSLSRASAPDEAALLADPIAKEAQPDSVANSSDARSAASSGDAQSPGAADGSGAGDGGAAAGPAAATLQDMDAGDSGSNGAAGGSNAAAEVPANTQSRGGGSGSGSSAAAAGAGSQGVADAAPGEPVAELKSGDSATAPASKVTASGSGKTSSGSTGSKGSSASKPGSGSKGSKGSSASKPGCSSKDSKGGSGSKKGSSGKGSKGSDGDKGGGGGGSPKAKGEGPAKPAGRKAAAGQRGSSGSERVTLAMQAGDRGSGAAAEAGSLAFAPAGCQLIPGQKAPLQWPKCASPPGHIIPGGPDCSFNLTEELQPCPIIGGGLYFEHQKPQPARDVPPFWRERGSGSPSCKTDGVCCSGDAINGSWHDTDAAQAYGALEFRLDKSVGCQFHQYTRRQVLSCLANTTVVFWGDSMVRQTFNRIPALFRGHRRVFDAQTWRAERFEVCEAADLRTHAPAFEGLAPRDNHYRLFGLADLTDEPHPFLSLEQVPEADLLDVLDPHAQLKAFPGETCGDTRPVSFQYVPATALWEQYRFGGYYLKTHTDVSQSIWVSQVGYWDLKSREADANYLKTMQEALDRGIQKLVIITVPTAYVGIDERDPRRWILRDRNDFLRRWAANDTSGRTVILDMDTLSLAPNAPSGLLGNWTDWHYSCKFSWVDEHEGRNLTAEQWAPHSHSWLDPSGWSLGGLQPNLRRDCVDDMNLTVLQILFNMLCNKK